MLYMIKYYIRKTTSTYDGEVIDYWKEVNQYISNNKEELEIAKRNYDNMFAKAEISEMYELN